MLDLELYLDEVGKRIMERRKKLGLTQEALAEMVDITLSHMQHIENGHRNPSVKVLFQLAQCLDLSLDALVFPDRPECPAIHTDGLTQEEIGALARLADLMRNRRAP